jgi:hypothetical protein
MRKYTSLVLVAAALLVGCGHTQRPQYSTVQTETALTLYLRNESLDDIKVKCALADTAEARRLVRAALLQVNHRYHNE